MTPYKGVTHTHSTGPGSGTNQAFLHTTLTSTTATPTMATLALSNATSTSSVASLTGLSHRQSTRHSATASAAAIPRAKTASSVSPTASVHADARKRVHTGSGICDTNSNATPPLAQLAKSSFSASTPNYILINKLRIQEQAVNRARRTPTLPSTESLSRSTVSFAQGPQTGSSSHRARLQLNAKSASVTHSPTRSSANAISPTVLTRSSLSGPLSSGRSSSANRPVVTRVTAQDWLSGNQRKDLPTAKRSSKLIAPNSSSISSSHCSSLHDSSCLSSPGYHSKKVASDKSANTETAVTITSKLAAASSSRPGLSVKSISSSRPDESVKRQQPKVSQSPPAEKPVHGSDGASTNENSSSGQLRFQPVDEASRTISAVARLNVDLPSKGSPLASESSTSQLWVPVMIPQVVAKEKELAATTGHSHDQSEKLNPHCDKSRKVAPRNLHQLSAGQSALLRRPNAVGRSSRDSATVDVTNMAATTSKQHSVARQSVNDLLAFIEKSSPELIFLLSESAKLSYHLCQFEAKLDYLEQIFCNKAVSDTLSTNKVKSTKQSDDYQSSSWSNVIQRTRNWIAGIRQRNILLEKRPAKRSTRAKSKTAKEVQYSSLPTEVNKSNETSILTSEDELIVLLDRIVKFSSNIVTKLSRDQGAQATSVADKPIEGDMLTENGAVDLNTIVLHETLNSLSAENNAKCKYEWLQSLPSNIKDLMGQLFPDAKSPALVKTEAATDKLEASSCNANFEHIYELNPELLKALIENVKTNARLVQLRREFDRLMCSHLKSIGHSTLIADTNKKGQSKQPTTKPNRPTPPTGTHVQPYNDATKQATSQQFQRSSGNGGVQVKWKHSGAIQSVKSKETDQVTGTTCSHELSNESNKLNCCCANNMVSDGDSGGEFTATTVTNDFAQTTDDELSSLLNQIAICSQKIIEQTGATSTSNNSTTSSGCCCSSTSIDAKCGDGHGCSMAAHFGNQTRSLAKDCSHLDQTWVSPPHSVQFKKPPHPRSATNCCQNCTKPQQHPMLDGLKSQATLENLHKLQHDSHQQHFAKQHSFSSQPHTAFQSPRHWPLGHSFDEDYLHTASVGSIYGEAAKNKVAAPAFHAIPKRSSGLAGLNEPFIVDNMTGFMFSPSAMDLMSVSTGHAPTGHHFLHPGRAQQYAAAEQYQMAGSMAEVNSANAFMFDPNVDVESFLNEVEKELDDNCFASAPPFPARNTGVRLAAQAPHLVRQQHEFPPPLSPHRYGVKPPVSVEHGICHHSTPAHGATLSSTPLVNAMTNQAKADTLSQSYSSLNFRTVPLAASYPSHLPDPQTASSLLAGGNWRLSQRHSTLGLEAGLVNTPNIVHSHFPFPSTASMPMTGAGRSPLANANLSESLRYKRLIVPSASRDLLDTLRAQVSNRVVQETDNQLRQVEQWFQEHVQASMARTQADPTESRANQRRFSASEMATNANGAPTDNLIFFGN